MKESKTREFFENYDFENQNSQEHTDANETLGGGNLVQLMLYELDYIFYN